MLDRSAAGEELTQTDVVRLFNADPKERELLFETARNVRDREYGDKIFTYGFVYFSTYCKNNCSFCYFRNTNVLERYRKTTEEIVELSKNLRDAGINLVDLTMGEDPVIYENGCARLLEIIQAVRDAVDIGIMVSPGAVPEDIFIKMKEAGADFYACYQETYNFELFKKLRLYQDYQTRIDVRRWAKEAGMLSEDGMLVGVGETVEDRADFVMRMGPQGCEQIRAMSFVPQDGTPMSDLNIADSTNELLAIAIMRIMYPESIIPATLDVEGISGMLDRLNAGANLITSIVLQNRKLAGVAQHELDIENGNRSVEHVFSILKEIGKRPATNEEFQTLLNHKKAKLRGH